MQHNSTDNDSFVAETGLGQTLAGLTSTYSVSGVEGGARRSDRMRLVGWSAALIVTALLAVLLLGKVFGGSMATIAGPDSPVIARIHAETAGRSLAYRVPEVAREVCAKAGASGPIVSVVRYKVHTGGTLEDIARIFGMPLAQLKVLNQAVSETEFQGPGEVVTVYRHGVKSPEGTDDKLLHSNVIVPMPDGKGRKVRRRGVSWGTPLLVKSLNRALDVYGDAFTQGPVVIVSDISRRGGGRLRPHHTHRQGRDVDLSYIPRPEKDNGGFMKMTSRVFDRERNWTFLKALLDTGNVELILMDRKVQKMLVEHARANGAEDSYLREVFQYPRDSENEVGVIRHWDGHQDHMHVRFACLKGPEKCD